MSKTQVTPIFDRILVRPVVETNTTPAGLILPFGGGDEDTPKRGTIIAAGTGLHPQVMVVKVGDKIYFNPQAGIPIKIDGEELLMMRQMDVMMVYEGEEVEVTIPATPAAPAESTIILNN